MNILITGATGFIGSYLAPFLAKGHQVFCLARDTSRLPKVANLVPVPGDLAAPNGLASTPEHVDAIIHLAQANVPFPERGNELFDVNTLSTQRLADYSRRSGASHFIYASSGSVYASTAERITEESTVRPQGFYALTKAVSEQVLACYQPYFHICVLRLFAPYGPGQTGRMIPGIINRVRSGQAVTLTNGGQPRINPIYIDDVVRVMEQALSLTGEHTVNVAGPEGVSIGDIATIAGKALGMEPRFEHRTDPVVSNLLADTTLMQKTFSLPSMVSGEQGIRRTAKAVLEQ